MTTTPRSRLHAIDPSAGVRHWQAGVYHPDAANSRSSHAVAVAYPRSHRNDEEKPLPLVTSPMNRYTGSVQLAVEADEAPFAGPAAEPPASL